MLNSSDPIENTVVESYQTEREALLAWTDFVQRENPDIIIGYNIHGWDELFMFERSQELNCVNQFSKLSRNKGEKCLKEVWQGPNRPKENYFGKKIVYLSLVDNMILSILRCRVDCKLTF